MDIEKLSTMALSKRWAIVGRWKQKQKPGGKLHRTRRVWERHWEEKTKIWAIIFNKGDQIDIFYMVYTLLNKQ